MMGETLCCINITAVACHRIGIGIHLVHAAKLVAQHRLHALIVKRSYDSKPPVAEFKEHIPGSLVPGVHPCVTQSGIRLVHIVPWHPVLPYKVNIPFSQLVPQPGSIGHTTHIAVAVCVLTTLKLRDHIVHTFLKLRNTCSGIMDGECRKIMSADMSVKPIPAREAFSLGSETCLLEIWGKQPVRVILQKHMHIEVTRMLERTVKQLNVPERELIVVKSVLSLDTQMRRHEHHRHDPGFNINFLHRFHKINKKRGCIIIISIYNYDTTSLKGFIIQDNSCPMLLYGFDNYIVKIEFA